MPGALRRLLGVLEAEGVVGPDRGPGPHHTRWAAAGFARLWVDDPGQIVLFANRQGGFSVHCPATGSVVTAAFSEAWRAHRAGAPSELSCGACGQRHALAQLRGRPPFALGSVALVTSDVGAATLHPEARARVEAVVGPVQVVLRRG